MTRLTRDQWGVQLALVTAQRSTCCRRNVGCVLVDSKGHVLATGYNGVATGQPHCNELGVKSTGRKFMGQQTQVLTLDPKDPASYPNACEGAFSPSGTNLDGCHAIHAEQNALIQCRDVNEVHTCYVTASPCITCVKMLLNTGCRRIVFFEPYPHTQSQLLWEAAGRDWTHLPG